MSNGLNPIVPPVGPRPLMQVTMVFGEDGQPVIYAEMMLPPGIVHAMMAHDYVLDNNAKVIGADLQSRLQTFVRSTRPVYQLHGSSQ